MLSPIAPILPSSRSARELGQLAVEINDLVAFGSETRRAGETAHVDHVDSLDAELGQVRLHRGTQLLGTLGRDKAAVRSGRGADLADEHEVVGVRGQGLKDQPVGDAVAVEVSGIDVVDAELDGAAQYRDRDLTRRRRTVADAGQLHRAEADPGDGPTGELERAAGGGDGHGHSSEDVVEIR